MAEVNIIVTATDKASQILAGIGKNFDMIAGSVKDLTKEYIGYGDQVMKLAKFTGASNEETSRMIQLADDAFVEVSSLQMALKTMASKGLVPTVEGLAQASDEFLAIQDPLQRSQYLLDKFGRSGIEMAKIMELGGDAIRQNAAAISDSLIIDEEKAAKIVKAKQALDNFNDELAGMRYQTAGMLLDIFQGMPKPIQDATLAMGQFLSSENINTMVQMGILLKNTSAGADATAVGLGAANKAAVGLLGTLGKFAAAVAIFYELYTIIKNISAYMQGTPMPDQGGMYWQNGKPVPAPPTRDFGGPGRRGQTYQIGAGVVEYFTPSTNGNFSLTPPEAATTPVVLQLTYAPVFSTADQDELQTRLQPFVETAVRKIRK